MIDSIEPLSAAAAKYQFAVLETPFTCRDRGRVTSMLKDLPTLYPNGGKWLERRLDGALAGKARVTLSRVGSNILGVTIETPKGKRRIKLSTIFVDEDARGHGVGSRLLASCVDSWARTGIEEAIVTVRVNRSPQLMPLLSRFGFNCIGIVSNRYGELNDEAIFKWIADRSSTTRPYVNEDPLRGCDLLWD